MTDIVWDETGAPISTRFNDPYFSMRDGLAETNHVFIEGNDLSRRWNDEDGFHIAELGFGTGLNFFATLLAWQRTGKGKLTYTSFELYPMADAERQRALAHWPDITAVADDWIELLSDEPGWHQGTFRNVQLNLGIGDAKDLLADMKHNADAWYLDGFSPAKNPELWSEDILNMVGQKTHARGTFATYSAAGWVRRRLENAGFEVERIKGFGTKRHMSRGVRKGSTE